MPPSVVENLGDDVLPSGKVERSRGADAHVLHDARHRGPEHVAVARAVDVDHLDGVTDIAEVVDVVSPLPRARAHGEDSRALVGKVLEDLVDFRVPFEIAPAGKVRERLHAVGVRVVGRKDAGRMLVGKRRRGNCQKGEDRDSTHEARSPR